MKTGTLGPIGDEIVKEGDKDQVLCDVFLNELERLENPAVKYFANEYKELLNEAEGLVYEFVHEFLVERLNEHAPEGCFFGAFKGEYGFWVGERSLPGTVE